jgi:hypothetical protein
MSKHPALVTLKEYWTIYGGFGALFTSIYFWLAFSITVISTSYPTDSDWFKLAISVLPIYFGFSVTAYGLILSVGGSDIIETLSTKDTDQEYSDYQTFSSTFFHYLTIQFIAVVLSISASISSNYSFLLSINHIKEIDFFIFINKIGYFIISYLGFFMFWYGVFLGMSVLISIFRISMLINTASEVDLTEEPARQVQPK